MALAPALWILVGYEYGITHYFDFPNLVSNHWYTTLTILVAELTGLTNPIFYARQVYFAAPRYRWIVALAVIAMFGGLGFSIAATVKGLQSPSLDDFATFNWIVCSAYGCTVFAEILLASTLIWWLLLSKSGFARTNSVVSTLVTYVIHTGLLNTIFGLLVFVFALVYPRKLIYTGISIVGIKLCSISVLAVLYALMLHQTYQYFRTYPGDRLALKSLVLAIVFMETLHTVLWIIICYEYLVVNYFNLLNVVETHWYIKLSIPLTAITGTTSQIFYAGRLYYIGPQLKYRLLVAVAAFVMFLALGWDFAATVKIFRAKTIFEFSQWTWIVAVAYGFAVLTDTVVDTLVLYAVNTGLLTTIIGSLVFIFALVYPDNLIYAGLSIPGVKLYSNSVLAMLNSRRSLSERMMQGFEAGSHGQGRGQRSQAPHTVLETWNVRQVPVSLPVTMDLTRSLRTHSDTADEPTNGEDADASKATLADVQAKKADLAYVDTPVDHAVPKDTAVTV
ncbi:uncharacterized protein TRAVEDRAFT_53603 [Trametes versicolor FP-101664 SS1]|uniref:uncharacterized protein n=1 Tax=Trametes versicolor (strain FP-101664) TaxID=717944 RepID=UPI0004624714|nr:uncharacterized protein TRAVEDRAFT_53603 [Trametes versicolor FP-101664 SS1]EIW52178.1 hypothetical protein TRAVEDRAFT_53603 [Trametes versicolor FP-101664 SS1]